jgi:hypothetical protein
LEALRGRLDSLLGSLGVLLGGQTLKFVTRINTKHIFDSGRHFYFLGALLGAIFAHFKQLLTQNGGQHLFKII